MKEKKILIIISILFLTGGLTGCSNKIDISNNNETSTNNNESEIENTVEKNEERQYTSESLEDEISKQPVIVYSTDYLVQDESYKCLYPDILIANIKNNSGKDIKNVTIAFVAWDSNNFPIKIDPKYGRTSYLQLVDFDDVNLVNGQTYDDNGLGLSCTSDTNINSFKAIVVDYSDFSGNKWKNPLYEDWKKLYENKQL